MPNKRRQSTPWPVYRFKPIYTLYKQEKKHFHIQGLTYHTFLNNILKQYSETGENIASGCGQIFLCLQRYIVHTSLVANQSVRCEPSRHSTRAKPQLVGSRASGKAVFFVVALISYSFAMVLPSTG